MSTEIIEFRNCVLNQVGRAQVLRMPARSLCLSAVYLSLFSDSVFIVLHTVVFAYQVSVSVCCLALSLFSVSIPLHTRPLCLPAECVSLFSVSIEVLSLLLPGLCVCLLSLSVSIRCLYFLSYFAYRICSTSSSSPSHRFPPSCVAGAEEQGTGASSKTSSKASSKAYHSSN